MSVGLGIADEAGGRVQGGMVTEALFARDTDWNCQLGIMNKSGSRSHTLLLLLCDLWLMCMVVVIRIQTLLGLFVVGDCCSQGKQSPASLANFGSF